MKTLQKTYTPKYFSAPGLYSLLVTYRAEASDQTTKRFGEWLIHYNEADELLNPKVTPEIEASVVYAQLVMVISYMLNLNIYY